MGYIAGFLAAFYIIIRLMDILANLEIKVGDQID